MQATCWKSDEFRYILQPVSCSHPIFQIKKHICTFHTNIHSLKYFQSIYHSCCKVRTLFVTCKLGDCHVWMLTNPINSKPKHNSGSGVGIWTDSKVGKLWSTATNVHRWDRTSLPTGHLQTQNGSDLQPNFRHSICKGIRHKPILGSIPVRIWIGHSRYIRVEQGPVEINLKVCLALQPPRW